MSNMIGVVLMNLEKVSIGVIIFLLAYVSNMCLGAWKNVKIEGSTFDWNIIKQSCVKFIVLGIGIGFLSCAISAIPVYSTYVGIEIGAETMETIDSLVIIGSFLYATVKYTKDAISKLTTIFNQ